MIPAILIGYAVGSLPIGYLLAQKRAGGIDLRTVGSGNVGATNVYRAAGLPTALAVMCADMAKGAAAVWLAGGGSHAVAAGVAAVIGHIYPIWLRFHGGKGVAVAAGVFSVLAPFATMLAAGVFFATVWLSRIVSLGSVAATLTLPSVAWLAGSSTPVLAAAIGTGALILFRHRANMRRIVRGTERRVALVPRSAGRREGGR